MPSWPTYLGRYIGRVSVDMSTGRVSVDMSTDVSVEGVYKLHMIR